MIQFLTNISQIHIANRNSVSMGFTNTSPDRPFRRKNQTTSLLNPGKDASNRCYHYRNTPKPAINQTLRSPDALRSPTLRATAEAQTHPRRPDPSAGASDRSRDRDTGKEEATVDRQCGTRSGPRPSAGKKGRAGGRPADLGFLLVAARVTVAGNTKWERLRLAPTSGL